MKDLQDKVCYAYYGSNLLEWRFLCYIKGGQLAGAKTVYGGCLDKTIPYDSEDMYINCELHSASADMSAQNTSVIAIRMSVRNRGTRHALIFHSDRGSYGSVVERYVFRVLAGKSISNN